MADQPVSSLGVKLAFAGAGLGAFALFTYLRNSDFGAAAALAMLSITVAGYSCWDLHRRAHFWPLLIVVTAAHVVLLLRANVVLPKPTIVLAPLVILDFAVIVALLIGIDRLVQRFTE